MSKKANNLAKRMHEQYAKRQGVSPWPGYEVAIKQLMRQIEPLIDAVSIGVRDIRENERGCKCDHCALSRAFLKFEKFIQP